MLLEPLGQIDECKFISLHVNSTIGTATHC